MAEYTYTTDHVNSRSVRILQALVWIALSCMLAFALLSAYHPALRSLLHKEPRLFPLILVSLYLIFLLPSRRLYRYQRIRAIKILTSRKGITYQDGAAEQILSWREIASARITLDVWNHNVFPRKITLLYGKKRVNIEIDRASSPLIDFVGLLEEIERHVEIIHFSFVWFHSVCPFCTSSISRKFVHCSGCHRLIRYISKFRRPWELLGDEGLYLVLLLLLCGPLFYPLVLLFVITVTLVSLLRNRPGSLLPWLGELKSQASGLVAILTGLILAASTLAAASPAPTKADVYFPLAVGNTWEYLSNYQPISMKVTRKEIVNGVSCFVVESFVGSDSESAQKEYYAITDQGLEVFKRTHKGSDFFLKTPETLILSPPAPSRRWTWEGPAEEGNVFLAFSIRNLIEMKLPKLNRTVLALPVLMQGRSNDGSEIQTKRWYTAGIGMVRELTLMKKSHKTLKVEADLVNYSLRQE